MPDFEGRLKSRRGHQRLESYAASHDRCRDRQRLRYCQKMTNRAVGIRHPDFAFGAIGVMMPAMGVLEAAMSRRMKVVTPGYKVQTITQ
jgi:hypothetical protein